VPLGRKKKLLFTLTDDNPLLESAPSFRRLVQPADERIVEDEIATFLLEKKRGKLGRVPLAERGSIINTIVTGHFEAMEREVSTLSPRGLLESLVALNEALVREQALQRLSIPARVACYGDVQSITDTLAKEIPDLNRAVVASRFVIEYIAATPPNGLRPFSLSVYDRLMALSAAIIHWGFASDVNRLELGDVGLVISDSGRPIQRRTAYDRAHTEFLAAFVLGEVDRTTQAFKRHWSRDKVSDSERMSEVDRATLVEFQVSLSDIIRGTSLLMNLGSRRENPLVIPVNEIKLALSEQLEWESTKAQRFIELLEFRARLDFLRPHGMSGKDVYPWNFDRRLSYLRRPLLIRESVDGPAAVCGRKHVYLSALHYIGLCRGGRLHPSTLEMTKLVSSIRREAAEEFNDLVASFYEATPTG
jgi:hypothetical protein